MRKFALLACAFTWGLPAYAGPQEDALSAFDKFFPAFVTENHEQVAGLFAPDALFYGTASANLVTTSAGVRDYFTNALSAKNGTAKATPLERTALVLSDDVVAVSGKWQVERTVDGKTTTAGPFRTTAVMQKRGNQWLIAQFHNSPTPPQSPSAAPATSPQR